MVAPVGLGDGLHQQRGVGHGPGHRPHHAAQIGRVHRHPPRTRLQRHDAAPGGGQSHRAADIGAQMQRPISRRRRRTGAGRGAAGIAVEVPRVARQPVEAGKPGRQHPVVRHRGLAQDHRPRLAHARRRRRVRRRRHQLGRRRPERHRHAPGRDILLDRDRHAVERPARRALHPAPLRLPGRRQRPLRIERPHRVQRRLSGDDAGQHRLGHLHRRQRPAAIGMEQFNGGAVGQMGHACLSANGKAAGRAGRAARRPAGSGPAPPA